MSAATGTGRGAGAGADSGTPARKSADRGTRTGTGADSDTPARSGTDSGARTGTGGPGTAGSGRWRARAERHSEGLERFLDIYLDERLLPYSRPDSELMRALEGCLNCGTCLSVCPVVGAGAGHPYPGPRTVGTSLSRSLPEFWAAADLAGFCTTCMACEEACPGDVPVYRAVLMMRAKNFERSAREGREPLSRTKLFLVDFFAGGRLSAAARWGAVFQGLAFRRTESGEMKARVPLPVGPLAGRVVPSLAPRSLTGEFPDPIPGEDPRGPRVAVFAGCLMNHAYTETGRALVSVLRRHCREVVVPADQVCCGAPALYSGDLPTSRRLAAENARVFEAAGADFIVTGCATCGDVLGREYPALFAAPRGVAEPEEAGLVRSFSARVRDVHVFLLREVEFRRPGADGAVTDGTVGGAAGGARGDTGGDRGEGAGRGAGDAEVLVTIHDPCHLARGQGVRDEVRELVGAIPGVVLREMREPAACCGGAGSFSLDHYELASAIRDRKVADIDRTGAGVVLTGCPSCRMHIADGLERAGRARPVRHPVELLAEAYERDAAGSRGRGRTG